MATTSLTYGLFARDNASPVFAKLSRNISNSNRQMGGFSRSFASAGAAVARTAGAMAVAAGAATAAAGVLGLKTAASLEQAKISFDTLLGSAKKASAFLKDVTNFGAATPFQVTEVIGYSKALLGAGEAAKKIIPSLTAWGDASAALGLTQDQFSRTMLAVTQIMNRGKVQGDDLKQITQAGIPIWTLMARALHMPISALQGLAKEGKLLSKDVLPALEAQMGQDYGGAMGRQAQTLNGLWSQLKDNLSLGLAKAIKPLLPLLKQGLGGALGFIGGATKDLAGFLAAAIPAVQGFFGALRDNTNVQGVMGWLTGSLIPALKDAARRVFPAVQQAWGDISNVIAENRGVFKALGDVLTGVVIPFLAEAARIVAKVLGPAFTVVVVLLRDVVLPAFVLFTKGVLVTLDAIVSGAAWAFGWVPGLGPKLKAANRHFDEFAAGVNASLENIRTDLTVNVHIQPVMESVQTATHNKGFIGPTMAEGLAAKGIAGPYTEEQRGKYAPVEKAKKAGEAVGKALGGSIAAGLSSTAPEVDKAGDKVKKAAVKKFDEIKSAADQLRSSVHDSVMGFFTLQSEGNPFANLGKMAHKAVAFAAALGRLTKQGVNPAVISMIAQAGPDVGLRAAQMLSTAGKANRGRINDAYSTIDRAANRAAGYVVGAQTPDSLGVARRSEGHLARIERAVTKHHRANPLANGWAAY